MVSAERLGWLRAIVDSQELHAKASFIILIPFELCLGTGEDACYFSL
jgi:hypothetical protein